MRKLVLPIAAVLSSVSALAFDHCHNASDDLLKKHVKLINNGNASQVDYKDLVQHRILQRVSNSPHY